MSFNINELRAELVYGGARPALFQVAITNPIDGAADLKIPFLCEAAQIPASVVTPIPVPYFGRFIKVPGDRPEFEPWPITIINDEDFLIRNAFESWHNAINALERNIATQGSEPSNYKSQATVTQFGKDGSELRVYQFNGAWPSNIEPIDLNWATQNEIERFNVTIEYDNYEIVAGSTGDGGGR